MKALKLLLLLTTLSIYSQKVELRWAEKINTRGDVSILGGKDGKYYTAHRDNDKHLVCRAYDKNLNLKDEKTVSFDLDEKRVNYMKAYFLKNKIVHFILDHQKKEDKYFLYAASTDLKLITSDKTKILDETSDDDFINESVSISPDSTKIVVYNEHEGKRKEPNTLSFKVYNSDLTEVLLDKSVQLPIKSRDYTTESTEVDNLGNIYILAKIQKERDERVKDQSKYYYKVVVITKDATPKEFDFDYPERDIESIDILPGENNTLICTGFLKVLSKGFLSNNKKTLISDEMFSAIIDCKTTTLKSSTKYELDGLYPEKPKKAEDYVPYKVRRIFNKKDGGSVVVAEQYKLVVVTRSTQYGTTTSYYYYYCDIAVIQINDKSEVVSVSKMPKYQMNAKNPSIISTHFDGTTYIVYDDLEKNANAEGDKDTKRSTSGFFTSDSKNALFLLTIAPSGEMKKEVIYSYKDSKIRPYIKGSSVISKNEMMLNANDQIGVLKIIK